MMKDTPPLREQAKAPQKQLHLQPMTIDSFQGHVSQVNEEQSYNYYYPGSQPMDAAQLGNQGIKFNGINHGGDTTGISYQLDSISASSPVGKARQQTRSNSRNIRDSQHTIIEQHNSNQRKPLQFHNLGGHIITPSSVKKAPGFIKPPIGHVLTASHSQTQFQLQNKAPAPRAAPEQLEEVLNEEDDEDTQGGRSSNGKDTKLRRNIFGEHSIDKMKSKPNIIVSPYNVSSIKALPKFKASNDSKSKKPAQIPTLDTLPLEGAHETSGSVNRNGGSTTMLKHNKLTDGLIDPQHTDSSHQRTYKSTTNAQAFVDQKPHLPPLDQKGIPKKRFVQKGVNQSQEMNLGASISIVDPSQFGMQKHTMSDVEQQFEFQAHHTEDDADEDKYRRVSQNPTINVLGTTDDSSKNFKTEVKNRYGYKNSAFLQQSPYNQSNTVDVINSSLMKKQPLAKKTSQPLILAESHGTVTQAKRKIQTNQHILDHSPISRNLKLNTAYPTQTQAPPQQQEIRNSPQVRPQESHAHTRGAKLRYKGHSSLTHQGNNTTSNTKGPLLQQPFENFSSDEIQKKTLLKAHMAINMHTVQDNMTRGGKRFLKSTTIDNDQEDFSNGSFRGGKANSNERLSGSILAFGHSNGMNVKGSDLILSGASMVDIPDEMRQAASFSDRCSSINDQGQDETENNFKIGGGGNGDTQDDVRLFRDIEIRLKIEPLSLKLLQSIIQRIRSHVNNQGKQALGNMIGLLYQQVEKLTSKLTQTQTYSNPKDNSRTQMNIIKQLQAKNFELNAEVSTMQSEIRALKMASSFSPNDQESQVKDLTIKNQDLILELEELREQLAQFQSSSRQFTKVNHHKQFKNNSLSSLSHSEEFKHMERTVPVGPLSIPKLNLSKALQINMQMFKNNEQPVLQFQAPMESSNRGSYMGFKLHQNFSNGQEEGIPVAILHQPLVRPTTTMGGRKKLVNRRPEDQIIEIQEQNSLNQLEEEEDTQNSYPDASGNNSDFESLERDIRKKARRGPYPDQKIAGLSLKFEDSSDAAIAAAKDKKPMTGMKLKGSTMKMKGFHDEFMDQYNEFSLSWRQAIDREKRF